ncbi:MAG: aldo/keto reductase [Defluviitaleaceae bacterium]|nr:aldo/keto reductase [Defluviitaleaceae bacterium]
MKYLELNTGAKMPAIGLGVFLIPDGDKTYNSVRTALEIGYRHIDTAAIYRNEESVGRAIKDSGIPREEIFLTTKLWNEVMRTGNPQEAFEESLRKLDTDYIDLYLVHWPVPTKYVDAWLALEKIFKTQGDKVKAIGVSNFHEHHMDDIAKVWSLTPAVNQFELNPQMSQKPLKKFCKKQGIVVTAYCPLGGAKQVENVLANPILAQIGEKYGKTAAQVVLRWHIDQGISLIPKSTKPERIKENFDIFDFKLSEEDMVAIDGLNTNTRASADPDNFTF